MKNAESCNSNPTIIVLENKENNSMSEFPAVLETAILNWQLERRKKMKYFDGYREIAFTLGLASSTIRSYVNQHNPTFPPVNTLHNICGIIGDRTPIQYLVEING